jgi:hypothetical protein
MRTIKLGTIICSSVFLLVSSTSFASKARLSALQFADFWKDPQNVFVYPQYAGDLGQYATLELGATGKGAGFTTPHAEGGFTRKLWDGNAGLYLGHYYPSVSTALGTAPDLNNPFYLFFGNGSMGYGLNFSYSDVNSTSQKAANIGGTFGMKVSDIQIGAALNLYSKSEVSGAATKVLPEIELNANHSTGSVKYYGGAVVARTDVAGASSTGYGIKVGAQDHAFKLGQTGTFFYGAEVGYTKASDTDKRVSLPVYAGIEADIATWATLRGAISQALVGRTDISDVKDLNDNTTKVTFGAGLKAGGFDIDALLAAAADGKLNTADFASNLSATYHF